VASELDDYLEFNQWKAEAEDPYYDWRLVRKVRVTVHQWRLALIADFVLGSSFASKHARAQRRARYRWHT
jgi:hypothetical protein